MRKRLTKLALLGALVANYAFATEFRSPYISERGPLRYRFEKWSDKWSMDVWATMHRRESHKAYMKHGVKTKPLTALFFNAADFKFNQIFPNNTMPFNAVYYNPFVDLMSYSPRATYYEWGANIGTRFEYPVWKNKGRIGFRAYMPFRNMEIERDDITDKNANPTKDYVLRRFVTVSTGANPGVNDKVTVTATAYNLDLVNKLYYLDGAGVRQHAISSGNHSFNIFGQDISSTVAIANAGNIANVQVRDGIIYNASNKNQPAEPSATQLWAFNSQDNQAIATFGQNVIQASGSMAGAGLDPRVAGIGFFEGVNAINYTNLSSNDDQLAKMWLVNGYTNGILNNEATIIDSAIENSLKLFNENPFQWLLSKGNYEFETQQRTGIGDIDLDFFYEHIFSSAWIGELFVGVRFPTGNTSRYFGNPYRCNVGNGDHFEIKVGGLVAWEPLKWLNIKLDVYGSFALEKTEQRCAVYQGSSIKNIGEKVDADVDWQYFVGRLDFTFFHPKTKDISSLLGYEFYYKTEDKIHFKKSSMTPWYGDSYDGTSLAANLDNKLASKNTEAIGHKVRFETSCRMNERFELFGGGAYTFAGQHIPRETDLHGGVTVKF